MPIETNAPLPEWFRRPDPVSRREGCLFHSRLEEAIARLRISRDEVARWRAKGWLSFDDASTETLDDFGDPRVWELIIIRDLVRSGFADAQVANLLSQLPRPCSIDPDRLAFSFRHGWVEVVPPEKPDYHEIIESHLDSWIEECDEDRLREVRDHIGIYLHPLENEASE